MWADENPHAAAENRRKCPDLWGMCLSINEVVRISNMTELLLILHEKLEIS